MLFHIYQAFEVRKVVTKTREYNGVKSPYCILTVEDSDGNSNEVNTSDEQQYISALSLRKGDVVRLSLDVRSGTSRSGNSYAFASLCPGTPLDALGSAYDGVELSEV